MAFFKFMCYNMDELIKGSGKGILMKLKNKVALITGASRGIGRETAINMAKEGCNIIINYNNSYTEAENLKKEIEETYKVKALTIKADVSSEEEVQNMVEQSIKEFNTIDILVNNAGIAKDNIVTEKTKEEFLSVINTNLIGTFLVTKYVSKYMLEEKQGKIINITSTNAIDTYYPESIDYDASKAGIISLTRNFATYLAPYITVNAVACGWTNTDMNKELSKEQIEDEQAKILLNRFAEKEEIAKVITFLATEDANYINNTIIRVDGGVKNA